MSEPGKIRRKSINDINAQWDRIHDSFRAAYHRAEQLSPSEVSAELDRLNRRLNRVNATAEMYMSNISSQPQNQADFEEYGRQLRQAVKNPENRETSRAMARAIKDRANNRKYSRSVYARNNRK